MKRTIASLIFLLVVQCTLVAILYLPERGNSEHSEQLLPAAELIHLDEIQIEDQQDNEVTLQKLHGRWVLPELQNLPADSKRIEHLIDTLANQPHGFPVANSVAARQRFRVASYQFHRRLGFYGNDELVGTVYLGRSPAFRKVYARNDSNPAIFSLQYNNHDAPANADAWLDLQLLRFSDITRVSIDGQSVQRSADGKWAGRGGVSLPETPVKAILKVLNELSVSGLANEDMQRSLAESGLARRTIRVSQKGQETTLELFQAGQNHYVHDSRYSIFFRLGPRQYQRLMELDLADLVAAPQPGGA